jgi:hypothetical protein
MMTLTIGGIFLKALVLCGILFLVARHEADFEFNKVVWVTCGITLGNFALEAFLAPALIKYMPFLVVAAVTFVIAAAFVTFMVVRFCWVRFWKGIIIAILFMGFSAGLSLAGVIVTAKISQSVEETGGAKIEQNHKEALEIFREMIATSSSQMIGQAKIDGGKLSPDLASPDTKGSMKPSAASSQAQAIASSAPGKPAEQLPAFANTPEWQEARAKIEVSAVLVEGDRYTAMVNGKVLGVGDVLTVEVKKKSYQFKMAEITTDWVAWDPLGETNSD